MSAGNHGEGNRWYDFYTKKKNNMFKFYERVQSRETQLSNAITMLFRNAAENKEGQHAINDKTREQDWKRRNPNQAKVSMPERVKYRAELKCKETKENEGNKMQRGKTGRHFSYRNKREKKISTEVQSKKQAEPGNGQNTGSEWKL